MTTPAAPSTVELGTPGLVGGAFLETWEETAELRWPMSTAVYDRMRRSDGKLAAVRRAYRLPILRARWELLTDGVDPGVASFVAYNLGLPLPGEARARRRRHGIRFAETLSHALLYLDYGHFFAEQVYTVDRREVLAAELGPAVAALPREVALLRKLAPRMPRSIIGIDVARDGGLVAIRQHVPRDGFQVDEVPIPVTQLVAWVNEREGADWTGQSIHRASYKHWLIRDTLLRLGPIAVERNGLGLPVVGYPEGADRAEALAIAAGVRSGEDAGIALPLGWTLDLKGVTGSTKDELPLVKYHDEAMGKATLTMFLDLGHDAGARSLGDTFVDVFAYALQAVADELADVYTEHVIRDLVELNYGEGTPYPELSAGRIGDRAELTSTGLKELVEAGLLVADDAVREYVRERHDLPAASPAPAGLDALLPVPPVSTGLPAGAFAEADRDALLRRLADLNERALKLVGARP